MSPAIQPDSPLPSQLDLFSVLRVSASKNDSNDSFDDHLQRVAQTPQSPPQSATPSTNVPAANAQSEASRPRQESPSDDDQSLVRDVADPAPPRDAVDSQVVAEPPTTVPNAPAAKPENTDSTPSGDQTEAKQGKKASANSAAAKKSAKAAVNPAANAARQAKPAENTANQAPVAAAQSQASGDEKVEQPLDQPVLDAQGDDAGGKPRAQTPANQQILADGPRQLVDAKATAQTSPAVAVPEVLPQDQQAAEQPRVDTPKKGKSSPAATADDKNPRAAGSKSTGSRDTGDSSPDSVVAQAALVAIDPTVVAAVDPDGSSNPQSDSGQASAAGTAQTDPGSTSTPTDRDSAAGPVAAASTAKSNARAGGLQPASGNASSTNAGDVDRVRFVQRVSRALQTAGDGEGSLRLRLSPPELGSVQVEVSIKDGVMTARLQAETLEARAALLDSFPDLQQRLSEHDIKLERFEVDLADRSDTGGMPQGTGGQSDPDRGFASPSPRMKSSLSTVATETSGVTGKPQILSADQLNVVV